MKTLSILLLSLVCGLVSWRCEANPNGVSVTPQTTVTSFVPASSSFMGETRKIDSIPRSWQHPQGIGGRQTVTVLTEADSILVALDITDEREANSITIYPR